MDTLIVGAIGLIAGGYLVHKAWRQVKGESGCGCGSGSCGKSKNCSGCK